uniref:AP2/ERF domain-containing protein n=1 Tax=Chenopodium quinoa TaxID=63459 RepID=A0A803LUH9_CHEQI
MEGELKRLRGVVPTYTGKWGALTSVRRKRFWLGTYEKEIDAAVAYDRACLKLCRHKLLNFSFDTNECEFQSNYSFETIVSMIKDGTYPENYAQFLAKRQNLGGGVGSGETGSACIPKPHEPVMVFGVRIG